MNENLYRESIEYEKLVQSIYQSILDQETTQNIEVEHNVLVCGRSGVSHQIDVLWRFKLASVEHTVMIECKNYTSSITLEKVRNFFAVLHDMKNSNGIMVTKVGYQSGAVEFANYYGIKLKTLRKPTEHDWEGLVRNIDIMILAKTVLSSEDKPISVEIILQPESEEQNSRLEELMRFNRLDIASDPTMCFLDRNGNTSSEELRYFLPYNLDVFNKEDGGPYTQEIPLDDKYVLINLGEPDEILIKISKLIVTFYVGSTSSEIILHGDQIVEVILKDFISGEVEYLKRKAL